MGRAFVAGLVVRPMGTHVFHRVQALAAHCLGEGATKTARRLRVSRETVRLWRRRALGQIAGSLNDALSKERGLANLAPTR